MRIQKQLLAAVICLLLVFMAACGSQGAEPSGTPASEVAKETESASNGDDVGELDPEDEEDIVNPNATPEMDFDMGGRVIKLVSWYNEAVNEDNPDNIQVKKNLEALKAKHNFDIEYVEIAYGEIAERVQASLLAGDPVGDIIRLARPWMIPALTKQELFWPLDEYVKNDNSFRLQYTNVMSEYDGKGYGFRIGVEGAASGIIYNRTLMNELGIKHLQDYVDEGTWNWDTFIKVAKEADRDTNNDGKVDSWGLSAGSLLVQALAANDAAIVKDGKQQLDDPKTLETLNFLSRLAVENVARPTEGGDWQEPTQFFQQGNVLMTPGQDYSFNEWQGESMKEFELGFLPFPKGPSADGYRTPLTIPNYYTIPRAVENPEQLVYIWEKMHDIESIYDYRQQGSYETFFKQEEDLNNALDAVKVINIVEQIDYYPSMPYYEFLDEIGKGVSISTLVEKYKTPFQSAVDEVWGQ